MAKARRQSDDRFSTFTLSASALKNDRRLTR